MGPPQRPVGSLAPRTVLPLPSAQAHELGCDPGILVELRALMQLSSEEPRAAWLEHPSLRMRSHVPDATSTTTTMRVGGSCPWPYPR